ncbi:integrin beta-7-like [Oncorhynchus clarkii lewisi]|uniref:integrin beta-7-like n=1 Tax=Oncorhynchus clarkii lewisi TaxID=490388 RepID=UPI0039B952AD
MVGFFLLGTFILYCVGQIQIQGIPQICVSQPSCSACLRSPGCAWCKHKDFLKSGESTERRCDTAESLRTRGCEQTDIINPQSELVFLKNNELSSDPDNVVQLKPQNLLFKLRVGVPQTFSVSFKRAEGYPIDLYYLMDLSFSMRDDLDTIKNLGQEILSTLKNVTNKVRIGFGSFVDKVALPYVSQVKDKKNNPCPSRLYTCQPAFSFQNILGLTQDVAEFKTRVSNQIISGNLDSPESGFDAIMQAAVCQGVIGWNNVTRILVYTSDDTFHIAGDGRLAGIFEPNDGKCHLNGSGFYDGTKYDYPSVGQLARVLAANNIQLIFAVTEESVAAYKALSKLIPQSVLGVLKNDSSNVVQLILEAYSNLSSTILLEHHGAPSGLDVTYRSHCTPAEGDNTPWQRRGECMNVKLNQQVDFTVSLNISMSEGECLKEKKQFFLKLQGISETLKVSVETLCDCDCHDREQQSTHCNEKGTLNCGICSCDEDHLGQRCECEQPKDMISADSMDTTCRQDSSPLLCSGHGSCECGICVCQGTHRGDFCQCDDNSCDRHNNMLCSGNGQCDCGTCKCHANYTGSACDCSTLTDQCRTAGKLCNGQGTCQCNQCQCNNDFFGMSCSKIANACAKFLACVTCELANKESDGLKSNCSRPCGSVKPTWVEGPQEFPCREDTISYKVELVPDGNILVLYADLPRSVDKTYVIIGSSVSSIIFIGIAVILISWLMLEFHYRREYASFLKATETVVWKNIENPLFQDATTIVMNPIHIQED